MNESLSRQISEAVSQVLEAQGHPTYTAEENSATERAIRNGEQVDAYHRARHALYRVWELLQSNARNVREGAVMAQFWEVSACMEFVVIRRWLRTKRVWRLTVSIQGAQQVFEDVSAVKALDTAKEATLDYVENNYLKW